MSNALLRLAVQRQVVIEQKYLEKGHTQMEADSMHACTERKMKSRKINIPADYIDICEHARENPRPYKVYYSYHGEFKNFAEIGPYK